MAGRKLKLTPELIANVERIIRSGNYAQTACQLVGIGTTTYYRWLEMAEEEGTPAIYREFRDTIKRAEAEGEIRNVARIVQAADNGTWQASAWYLERKHPDRWGRNDKIRQEVAGVNGSPLEVTIDVKQAVMDFLKGEDEFINTRTDTPEA